MGGCLCFADRPCHTVPCNAPRMTLDPSSSPSSSPSSLPLPPMGCGQTPLSASQACSMLMQCDHFLSSTSLGDVKGIYIYIQHYQCGTAVLSPVLSDHHSGTLTIVRSPLRHRRSLTIYFSSGCAEENIKNIILTEVQICTFAVPVTGIIYKFTKSRLLMIRNIACKLNFSAPKEQQQYAKILACYLSCSELDFFKKVFF